MKQIVVGLIIIIAVSGVTSAQIILNPAQCTGTAHLSQGWFTDTNVYSYFSAHQPGIDVSRQFKYTGLFHWTITFGCGIIEFDANQTAGGGTFPTNGMTPYNWTAQLNGLAVIGTAGQGEEINVSIFDLNDANEDGNVTEDDWRAGSKLIARLFSTVPAVGTTVDGIDITDALRSDLFDQPGDETTGFLLEAGEDGWGWPETRIILDHALPEIEVNLHTPTPFATMTPTPTGTPTLSPTATPFNASLGVDLLMPGDMYHPGSIFWLTARLRNPDTARNGVPLFVILDIHGELFFWPTWTPLPDVDYLPVDVDTGYSDLEIIPPFNWPQNAGSASEIFFHAAMLNDSLTEILGDYASIAFGWTGDPAPTETPIPPTTTYTPTPGPSLTPSSTATSTSTPTATPTPTNTSTHAPTSTPTEPIPFEQYIPAGTYMRGSSDNEPDSCRLASEIPQHQVTLTRAFYIMSTEVTRQFWADLKASQPALPDDPSNTDHSPSMNYPAQSTTWYDAVLFANLLSMDNGLPPCYFLDQMYTIPVDETNYQTDYIYCDFDATGYRLPTEAEWEYAARAGTSGPFPFDEPNYSASSCRSVSCTTLELPSVEIHAVFCSTREPHPGGPRPVCTKLPNPLNLYDMLGNVYEWCWDWGIEYYDAMPVTDPIGPDYGTEHIIRGGHWNNWACKCRPSSRASEPPYFADSFYGFRLVRTADPAAATPTPYAPTHTPTQPTATPIPMVFSHINSGSFYRGSLTEACRSTNEKWGVVSLTRSFFIMATEVTRHMWAELANAEPSLPPDPSYPLFSSTINHPVQQVTWYECILFANLLSLQEGYPPCYFTDENFTIMIDETNYETDLCFCNFDAAGYRLPTEAEWEYAARAGTFGPFYVYVPGFNSYTCRDCDLSSYLEALDAIAWWCVNSDDSAHIVGQKAPNYWGVFDVHGNVREWCWDYSGAYSSSPVTDPTGPEYGYSKILRGGSFLCEAMDCRCACRSSQGQSNRWYDRGFRLVRTAP